MRFEYLEPASLEEAITLLEHYDGRAKVIAGGTDLVVQMRKGEIKPQYIINIARLPGLDYISFSDKEGLKLGALTTIRALEDSQELQQSYPAIPLMASQMATPGVRSMATLGGNLGNAAPSADTAPILIGLSAQAKIVGPEGERTVQLENFYTGPGSTCLGKGELLREIQMPVPPPHTGAVYLKHGARGAADLAIVGVATVITLEPKGEVCREAKVVLAAVAPTPIRAFQAEAILRGKKIDEKIIEASAQAASGEARPITDVRAPASYRREMVKVFTRRAIRQALALAKAA